MNAQPPVASQSPLDRMADLTRKVLTVKKTALPKVRKPKKKPPRR
jgi:hypothetical protein